ncbi:Methionine aminopeptidase 1 [Coemansia sp. RSA 1807]|nr:Methionine aminopeptidase 1 [Coemansia sp. RSA 562]KAJ2188500.1 Methionine aminopeptidase 1 [Coemansia sp. RSA 532]KAJ2228317.1 Methionine aminopeptidase 1 [Coemansia sp. RSA 518]KAJ2256619.1 Methionine aminopeptidase 1 [Coemansia sp. RSA 454]KAJ2276372.1 Methionine aminopeptidase 1 [Coemansia sp. RSA 371]KAJ2298283.1 Methionine aminopeptidase 1 [Coemansia sp. RSA 353]KAJ2551090.1 Methionine aminopeptidase 1 [Coemansia sp. RSA 1878]KAJ2576526.1 Methionine aminopeptidase 1 [Coemansia sp. R
MSAIDQHTCKTEGCDKPAALQCPTCAKLGLESYFCSQDCFRTNWNAHKAAHVVSDPKGTYNPFPKYPYTGTLRPEYPLTPRRDVPAHIPRPDYAEREDGMSMMERSYGNAQMSTVSGTDEETMRKVCILGREVLDIAARTIRPGVTTDEIDRAVHEATIERNAYPSPLNYYNFPKSVCTSVNEVICHGIPDQRKLQDGDIVNIDISLYKDGFHADLNKTYFVGAVDDASKKLVKTTRDCLQKAIDMVKPGVKYRDLGAAIEKHAKANGFSVVRTYCGHGVGKMFHSAPNVPHYASNRAIGVMKPGHVFTIEPMINAGSYDDQTWKDGWTAVTVDGKRSAQFEHVVLVTEDGHEVLTRRLPTSPESQLNAI